MRTPSGVWILAVASLLPAGCSKRADPEEAVKPPAVAVRAQSLEVRTFDDVVTAQGRWKSGGEVVVAAPFAGTIDSLAARLGDRLVAGQTICSIRTRESQAALRGANLLERRARNDAERLEAGRALELAKREVIRVPVVAPRSGLVTRRSVEDGAEVAESGEILAIVPEDAVVFEAHVPITEATRIRPGQKAEVSDQGGASHPAQVDRVLPLAGAGDQTSLVWLRARPGEPPADLDRFGTAAIVAGESRSALAVPDSAIVEDDLSGETRVARIDAEGRAIWTRVVLGLGARGWHELRDPALPPETRVITGGQRGLPDSTRVAVAS